MLTRRGCRSIEFDCRECGRHIISLGNQALQEKHGNLCAACFSIPGWFHDPELRQRLDPDMEEPTTEG